MSAGEVVVIRTPEVAQEEGRESDAVLGKKPVGFKKALNVFYKLILKLYALLANLLWAKDPKRTGRDQSIEPLDLRLADGDTTYESELDEIEGQLDASDYDASSSAPNYEASCSRKKKKRKGSIQRKRSSREFSSSSSSEHINERNEAPSVTSCDIFNPGGHDTSSNCPVIPFHAQADPSAQPHSAVRRCPVRQRGHGRIMNSADYHTGPIVLQRSKWIQIQKERSEDKAEIERLTQQLQRRERVPSRVCRSGSI